MSYVCTYIEQAQLTFAEDMEWNNEAWQTYPFWIRVSKAHNNSPSYIRRFFGEKKTEQHPKMRKGDNSNV